MLWNNDRAVHDVKFAIYFVGADERKAVDIKDLDTWHVDDGRQQLSSFLATSVIYAER